jgi:RNA polymerase sigma-70 factor (ECF subfamily)
VRAPRDDDFSRAYDQHVRAIYGFFGYRLGSRSDAEDLTQATFERALRAWGRFDPRRGSAKTWLFAIAHNLLIDHHRRGRSGREATAADPRNVETKGGVYALDERGLGPSPELETALAELPDRERELVALRFGGGLTTAQISRLVGLSSPNVDQILSRTLRALRARLEPAEPEETAEAPPRPGPQRIIRRRMVRRRRVR